MPQQCSKANHAITREEKKTVKFKILPHCACTALTSANILATFEKSELHRHTDTHKDYCMPSAHAYQGNTYTHFNGCTVNFKFPLSTDSIALRRVTQTIRMMIHAYTHNCNRMYM